MHIINLLWPRASWEFLEASIGKMDEPFQVTVQYTSCSGHDLGLLAIDSLELKDCNMGECFMIC